MIDMRDFFRRLAASGLFGKAARVMSPPQSASAWLFASPMSAPAAHRSAFARYAAASLSLVVVAVPGLGRAEAQSGHTSGECPAQTATVAAGGTVTINVTDCAANIAFAGSA